MVFISITISLEIQYVAKTSTFQTFTIKAQSEKVYWNVCLFQKVHCYIKIKLHNAITISLSTYLGQAD